MTNSANRVPRIVRQCLAYVFLTLGAVIAGCRTGTPMPVTRPTRHAVRSDQLLVLSDFKLSKDHELIRDLTRLRKQVAETLNLPLKNDTVVVYLFDDESKYRRYLQATYPGLPDRRAYFVGARGELAVYTYWGDRIQEDLRHEFTHGLLHADLKQVPLWIDEGLAEYFEVAGPEPGEINREYADQLSSAVANGWRPDLHRLERLEQFSQMQRVDYQEAWAWVHFLLHSTPEARRVLLAYLQDLRTNPKPTALSARLQREQPEFATRFLNYLATLESSRAWVGSL